MAIKETNWSAKLGESRLLGAQMILAFLDWRPKSNWSQEDMSEAWTELAKRSKEVEMRQSLGTWAALEDACVGMVEEDAKADMGDFFKRSQFAAWTAIGCMAGEVSEDELRRRMGAAPEGAKEFATQFTKSLAHCAVGKMLRAQNPSVGGLEKNKDFFDSAMAFGRYASMMPDECFAKAIEELKKKLARQAPEWSYDDLSGNGGRSLEVGVKLALARGINSLLRSELVKEDILQAKRVNYDRILAP